MLTAIPLDVQNGVLTLLGSDQSLQDFSLSGGGCINHGGRLSTRSAAYFIKWNNASGLPGMFQAEAKGLSLLAATNTVCVPDVIGHGVNEDFQFLILSYVEQARPNQDYWQEAGRQLAALHGYHSTTFGLDYDNYMGSLTQSNTHTESWSLFFVEQRLAAQVQLAADSGRLSKGDVRDFERLFTKRESLFPRETPTLIHGDLWRGNLISTSDGGPCFIDPAIYYGNREADLAMTKLFGGFDAKFYQSYEEYFPLSPDYAQRVDLYNLYPLLVHLNLFGESYYSDVMRIVKRYA